MATARPPTMFSIAMETATGWTPRIPQGYPSRHQARQTSLSLLRVRGGEIRVTIPAVLVDISINHEAGGGAKICVARPRSADSNSWHVYASVKEAEDVLLALGIRGKLVENLDRPLRLLSELGSREPIDFLSVEVPEHVLAKLGFKV
jgi:hypothetical protein